jgi:hypothetical protein
MIDNIDLKFQMTRGDLISALRQQAFRSWLLWLILSVFVIRLAMEIYYVVTLGEVPDGNVFSPWIAIALTFFVFFPFLVVRFRADSRVLQEQTWHFASDEIIFNSGQQSTKIVWSQLEKITLDGSFYQLHFSKQDVALIPRRVFSSAQAETEFKSIIKPRVKTNIQ